VTDGSTAERYASDAPPTELKCETFWDTRSPKSAFQSIRGTV